MRVERIRATKLVRFERRDRLETMSTLKKIWNIVSTVLVALVVLLALLLVGARLFGLRVYTVLSGSMEPTYHTGSLIYVRKVDPYTIEEGQPITFMLDENTVATHRVVGVVPDEDDPTVIRFRTKGDANEAEDGSLVHYKNVIGTPVFSIPYLGYVANYIQHPPGMYVAISAGAVLLLLVFLPDLFAEDGSKEKEKEPKRKKANRPAAPGHGAHASGGAFSAPRQHPRGNLPDPRPEPEAPVEAPAGRDDLLDEKLRRVTGGLLTDREMAYVKKQIREGRFDKAAADSLRAFLRQRQAERQGR